MIMRSTKAFLSASAGILNQLTRALLSLVVRRVFLVYISAEFLGLNTLFGSVISFLSLSELGVSSAVTMCLYRPLAEQDFPKVKAYVRLLRIFNRIMMAVILIGGTCLIPVVRSMINGAYIWEEVLRAYILYVLGTALSYLWSHYTVLLSADQKAYQVSFVSWACTFAVNIIQIVTIVVWKNYYIYLWTQIFYNLVSNYIILRIARADYPWLNGGTDILTKSEKSDFVTKIKGLFVYRIAAYLIQSMDNIIVSVILGTVVVAYYGNYYLIVNMLVAIVGNIGSAATAGLGNVIYVDDEKKRFSVIKNILFIQHMIFSSTAAAMLVLSSDFVVKYFGAESLCSMDLVVSLTVFYYLQGLISSLENVRAVVGCYSDKYWQLIVSGLNVIISAVLTYWIGLSGVVIGTVICYFIKGFVLTPGIIFGDVIPDEWRKEYMRDLYLVSVCFALAIVCSIFLPSMDTLPFLLKFVLKGLLSVCGVTALNWILLHRTTFYKENKEYFAGLFRIWILKLKKEGMR